MAFVPSHTDKISVTPEELVPFQPPSIASSSSSSSSSISSTATSFPAMFSQQKERQSIGVFLRRRANLIFISAFLLCAFCFSLSLLRPAGRGRGNTSNFPSSLFLRDALKEDEGGGASGKRGGATDKGGGASGKGSGASGKGGGASGKRGGASDKGGGASDKGGGASGKGGGASGKGGEATDSRGVVTASRFSSSSLSSRDQIRTEFQFAHAQIVENINSGAEGNWTARLYPRFAESNFDPWSLLGSIPDPVENRLPRVRRSADNNVFSMIPDFFDAREKWAFCDSLFKIRDQGSCSSCWAIAATAAISDRICIKSKGALQPFISTQDVLSCCEFCGNGCAGGYISAAWEYFVKEGIVTGGLYNQSEGCLPYAVEPCDRNNKTRDGEKRPLCGLDVDTPQCHRQCRKGYNTTFKDDKYYGFQVYEVVPKVEEIQLEIMWHGPVQASFVVYQDFFTYENGIYQHTTGDLAGGHAVKIIGWGTTDDGVPYWQVANSWNADWGDDGFFKIVRGKNECGIEDFVCAGQMRIKSEDFDEEWKT